MMMMVINDDADDVCLLSLFSLDMSRSSDFGEEFRLRLCEINSHVRAMKDLQQPCEGHVGELMIRDLLEVHPLRGFGRNGAAKRELSADHGRAARARFSLCADGAGREGARPSAVRLLLHHD